MKKYISSIFLLLVFFCKSIFAQTDEDIAKQSLDYLDKHFYLHLKKMNEHVLITINNYQYISNEFVDKNTLLPMSRVRFKYELEKVGENKYEFILKVISETKGSFEVVKDEDGYYFRNLIYVTKEN